MALLISKDVRTQHYVPVEPLADPRFYEEIGRRTYYCADMNVFVVYDSQHESNIDCDI